MHPATATDHFKYLLKEVTDQIGVQPLDQALGARLSATIPPNGPLFTQIFHACQSAIAAGWMCSREGGGIRYGRVIKASDELQGFSVDVVDMESLQGPDHTHPNGEIDLIMPLNSGARFDGRSAGWLLYAPGTAHRPTVTEGRALVLYLLPQGAIEFTR
jgi:hypothetical protein